jgi:hypothetical protein
VNAPRLNKPRLIVGLVVVAAAVLMMVLGPEEFPAAGVAPIAIIGIITIATAGIR